MEHAESQHSKPTHTTCLIEIGPIYSLYINSATSLIWLRLCTHTLVDMAGTVFYLAAVTSKYKQLTSQRLGKMICTALCLKWDNACECKSKPSCGAANMQLQKPNPKSVCQITRVKH